MAHHVMIVFLIGFSFSKHYSRFVPMALAVVAGTYTGKWILGKISEKSFVWLYKIVLTCLAIKLIADVFLASLRP